MKPLPHIAARIFGEPLAIDQKKLEIIVGVIGPRLLGFQIDDDDEDEDEQPDQPYGYNVNDGIATIDISGTLVSKSSGLNALSGLTAYADIAANFSRAVDDPAVGGIILSIDSPGGEVAGMFELADMIYQSRGEKPVCASVQCAASAAYMLASSADQIVVSRTAVVGSIGIIALHRDQSGADEKSGLAYTAVYSGARKNDGNPHAPLSSEATAALQSRIDQIYGMFTGDVARNRSLADSTVRNTQAGLYLGQAGIDAGLADSMGTDEDADAMLRTAISQGYRSLDKSSAASAANSTKENHMHQQNAADAARAAEAKTQLDTGIAAALKEAHAENALVIELCALAGQPNLASGFIAAKKNSDEVRKELMAAKAAAQPDLDPTVIPGKPGKPEGQAKPWSEVLSAAGIKTKGAK